MRALAALAFGLAFAAAGAAAPQRPASAPTGNADSGQRLYLKYGCYQCHGREAQGSPVTGPRLGPDAPSFAVFVEKTRQPTAEMPPYTATVVTDRELADIYAFALSRPRPPARIPLLEEQPPTR